MDFKFISKKKQVIVITGIIVLILCILILFTDTLLPFDFIKKFNYIDLVEFEHKKDPFRLLSINIFIAFIYDHRFLFVYEFEHTNLYLNPWDPYKLIIPLLFCTIVIYRTVDKMFLTFLKGTEYLQRCMQLLIIIMSCVYLVFTVYHGIYILFFILQDYMAAYVPWEIKTMYKSDDYKDFVKNISEKAVEKYNDNIEISDDSSNIENLDNINESGVIDSIDDNDNVKSFDNINESDVVENLDNINESDVIDSIDDNDNVKNFDNINESDMVESDIVDKGNIVEDSDDSVNN